MKFLPVPSKSPIQETQDPLELSVHELWEGALGETLDDGFRGVILVVEPRQFRYIPQNCC